VSCVFREGGAPLALAKRRFIVAAQPVSALFEQR